MEERERDRLSSGAALDPSRATASRESGMQRPDPSAGEVKTVSELATGELPTSPEIPVPALAPGPRPAVHRILRNSTFNLLAQALYTAVYLTTIWTLAHGLSKEAFGKYYVLFTVTMAVQLVLEAGLSTVLTGRIARARSQWRATVREATGLFGVVVLASLLAFLVLGVVWNLAHRGAGGIGTFVAVGVTCAAIQVQRYCAAIFQGFESFNYENISKILQGMLFTALVIVLVILHQATLNRVLVLFACSHLAAAIFLLIRVQQRYHCLSWRLASLAQVRDWLGESVPLGFGDVLRGLTWHVDTLLLGACQSVAVVATFSVAFRPLLPLQWVPRAVLTATFPSFAKMAGKVQQAALHKAFTASVRTMWIISLPIAVVISCLADRVIEVLTRKEYLDATLPLRILIWITVLMFVSFPVRFLFTALGRSQALSRLVLAVLVLKVAVELALIPWWGYYGACVGSLVTEAVYTVVGLVLCYRHGIRGVRWWALAGAALAAAWMAVFLWPLHELPLPHLLLAVLLATVLYFILCVQFGAVRRSEVGHLWVALTQSAQPAPRAVPPA